MSWANKHAEGINSYPTFIFGESTISILSFHAPLMIVSVYVIFVVVASCAIKARHCLDQIVVAINSGKSYGQWYHEGIHEQQKIQEIIKILQCRRAVYSIEKNVYTTSCGNEKANQGNTYRLIFKDALKFFTHNGIQLINFIFSWYWNCLPFSRVTIPCSFGVGTSLFRASKRSLIICPWKIPSGVVEYI